ncbi:hypothetical protein DSO57_1024100 [Entomophthora muscae]|uniref:Uncharacterized protein n=1 Tax=Entomophthora muscae TaxID=34485 RepID=A0ACC2SFQ4_9FUNG|nr:hypothetical protein DSO57_1024100 [Entomophthora muscae]
MKFPFTMIFLLRNLKNKPLNSLVQEAQTEPSKSTEKKLEKLLLRNLLGPCGVPVYQSPKCVLDHSQGLAGRDYHSLGSKGAFIHSQKEDLLRNLLVYGPGGQGNNMDLLILGVLHQYLGLLVIGLGLLLLRLVLLLLKLGLLHLKLGLWHCT